MTERSLSPANVGAGAVLIGGAFLLALPQHAQSILQLVIVAVAVSAGVYALARNVPTTGWISPFKWLSPFSEDAALKPQAHHAHGIALMRGKLSGRRQAVLFGPPLPPALLRQLRPLVAQELEVDPEDPWQVAAVRDLVSPLTFSVLCTEPEDRLSWFRSRPPNPADVAEVVHRVLDDLARLTTTGSTSHEDPRLIG